jgi:hypothetical protein
MHRPRVGLFCSLILVLASTLLVTTSCGGDDTAATTTPTTTAPAAETSAEIASGALEQIRQEFELNFSSTSWYTPPSTLTIEGTELVAHTEFFPDDEGRALAKQLCNALNGNFVLSNLADYGLTGVTVYAQDNPVASASGGGTC